MTSYQLYKEIMDENNPIDWGWINYVKRTEGKHGVMALAKTAVECLAPNDTSKNIMTRATKLVFEDLYRG